MYTLKTIYHFIWKIKVILKKTPPTFITFYLYFKLQLTIINDITSSHDGVCVDQLLKTCFPYLTKNHELPSTEGTYIYTEGTWNLGGAGLGRRLSSVPSLCSHKLKLRPCREEAPLCAPHQQMWALQSMLVRPSSG